MKKFSFKVLPANSNKGFCILAGINRKITPSHVTKMAGSVNRIGIIRPIVIAKFSFLTGVEEMYIIDGQHLYMALLREGVDFPYVEVEVRDKVDLVEVLALLNNSSKSWAMVDYITSWGSVHSDYNRLGILHNIYDIELSQLAEILMEGTCTPHVGGSHISTILKKGEFEINNEEYALKVIDYITDALKIVPRLDRSSNRMFISTYVTMINSSRNYDHKQFLVNLRVHKDKFKLATQDPEEYKKLFKTLI